MVTSMPAAPINGLGALPDELIDQYVKADGDQQLTLIDAYRLTALGWVERHTSHSMQRRAWIAMFDGFEPAMRLPIGPVHGVTSIGYVDASGAVVDMAGLWQTTGAYLLPAAGIRWPATANRPGAVIVRYEAGYDDVATEAPALQIAALLLVQHLFSGGALDDLPATISLLLDVQYRTPVMG